MKTVENSAFLGYNAAMVNTYQNIFTSKLLIWHPINLEPPLC